MTEILGLVPARGGSKGIPGKNIRMLAGKPLIAWTIQAGLDSHCIDRIVVSTDDAAIADVAREWGAETPFTRPASLADDASPQIAVVEHALGWLGQHEDYVPDHVLLLQPTSPLRTADDIRQARHIAEQAGTDAVVSVCEAVPHPYLARRIDGAGRLDEFCAGAVKVDRRQDLPPAYALNGAIYLNTTTSLQRSRTFTPGNTRPYIMPKERSVDIDTLLDFRIAECLLRSA